MVLEVCICQNILSAVANKKITLNATQKKKKKKKKIHLSLENERFYLTQI